VASEDLHGVTTSNYGVWYQSTPVLAMSDMLPAPWQCMPLAVCFLPISIYLGDVSGL
jgi:hypothetical protein